MADFLRKLFGHQIRSQPSDEDTDLTKFYTDSEYALQVFEQLVTATNLPKRLLVIHGIGGVGKSTLLKMYLLFCRRHHIPVALVASEEAPSPVDILADWADDLSHIGVTLPTLQKTLTHYRAIQAKVEAEAKRTGQAASQLASTLGKTAAKTAISMAASAIPIVGPMVGALGGESAEAFVDWLHGFLSKPDMDLYLDPAKRLDSDFLNDLNSAASHQRLVLMADTYEQMTALDEWMRELAKRLPKNTLLVIAGRTVPAWERAWQGWMGKAEIAELKEMTPDDLRILVYRYYAYIRSGDPDPKQVEAIVQFARGLPMVATTVVQLWVKYGAEDFQAVRPQVVADLADRLLEGVPREMRPAFEAAAALRYFNVDALHALLEGGKAEGLYAELRRWPFIRSRREGLAVHDIMREVINEALRVRTLEGFRTLHERAAVYYETLLSLAAGDEHERYSLERLYHRVRADESSAMQLFQERAEELTRYRLANRLRALLNDVNTYPLAIENSRLWREYYNARLLHLEARFVDAEEVYQAITENDRVEPKLRAYSLCDWGQILCRREQLSQPGTAERAVSILEESLRVYHPLEQKQAMSWIRLSDIYRDQAQWEKSLAYLRQAKQFFSESNDVTNLLIVLRHERGIYGRQGNLRQTLKVEQEMENFFSRVQTLPSLKLQLIPSWERAWSGRYLDFEQVSRRVLERARTLQDQEYLLYNTRNLALGLGLQGKCSEALSTVEESLALLHHLKGIGELEGAIVRAIAGIVCLKCGQLHQAEIYLTEATTLGQKRQSHHLLAPIYLAILYEVVQRFEKAEQCSQLALKQAHLLDRKYFKCAALAGLVRVKHAQRDYTAILPLWSEAEQLALQYEYNDYFTSLYLTRGHIAWNGLIPEWESGFDPTLHYYQLALIHALRFNLFMLDEALSGRELGTPLRPIIVHCLEHGEEGQQMLVALRDWWRTGVNDIGAPRPDTISPIPEGIPLLEAERFARSQEPGDGSSQTSVVEQINAVLTRVYGD